MSKKPGFKKLRGNRVFLIIPKKEESKLHVDSNTKDALQRELLKKMSRLTVHTVGDTVLDISPGDEVLVDPSKLAQSLAIPIEGEGELLLVSPFDVVLVW